MAERPAMSPSNRYSALRRRGGNFLKAAFSATLAPENLKLLRTSEKTQSKLQAEIIA
jgi:hypothetical protein